jgi:hypothetical protein
MKLIIALILALTLSASSAMAYAPLRIHFKNASRMTLDTIYVRSTGGDDWGAEHLRGKSVPPGGKVQILHPDGDARCEVEFLMTTSEGKEIYLSRRRLCEEHNFTFHGRN